MTKKQAMLRVLIFVSFLVLPFVIWKILMLFGLKEELDYDTFENRNKHEISEDVEIGSLTQEMETWYSDRVPFRSVILTANRGLDNFVEKPYRNGIEPLLLKAANRNRQSADNSESSEGTVETSTEALAATSESEISTEASTSEVTEPVTESSYETSTEPETTEETTEETTKETETEHIHDFQIVEHQDPDYENEGYDRYLCECGEESLEAIETLAAEDFYPVKTRNQVLEGRDGWLFSDHDIEDYVNSNPPSDAELSECASLNQALYDTCQSMGIQFYSISFPNKSRIYTEYMPSLTRSSQWRLQIYEDYLKANTTVPFNYIYDEMIESKLRGNYLLYYKIDTHWTMYGALVGVNSLHSMIGLDQIAPETVAAEPFDHLGVLAHMLGTPTPEPATQLTYKPEVYWESTYDNSDSAYGFFARGYSEFYSDVEDGRTIVIIGDSYLNYMAEFLKKEFAHTIFVNRLRLSEIDPAILKNTNILVFEFVERNMTDALWGYKTGLQEATAKLQN